MRLKKELDKFERSREFEQGILTLNKFIFLDMDEVLILKEWMEGKKFDTLSLVECNLCENPSILSLMVEDGVVPALMAFSMVTNRKFKTLYKNKAEALAALINQEKWLSIDLSINNLTSPESETILEAITTKQNKLRRLNFGFNVLAEKSIKLLSTYLQNSEKSSSFKYLQIPGTFNSNTLHFFSILIRALKNNNTLRELDLRNNNLTNLQLKELIALLDKNKTITEINLANNNGLHPQLLALLSERLEQNRKTRATLHTKILSRQSLLPQATLAIKNGDENWLDILVGLGKNKKEEEFLFNKENFDCFFKLRNIWFRCNLLMSIYEFLKQLESNTFQVPDKLLDTNAQLESLFEYAEEIEISIIKENLSRVCLDIVDDQLVTLTSKRKVKITNQFIKKIIRPALNEFRFRLVADSNLEELVRDYKEKYDLLETELEKIKKTHELLLDTHLKYEMEYERLSSLLTSLDLNSELQKEFEEISERILETNLDPNEFIDSEDNSLLLMSFLQNRPNCLKLLLARGGNILQQNLKGQSVFNELLSARSLTTSHHIVIRHIQVVLDKLWFNLNTHPELERIKNIKHILDRYLTILINNGQMARIKQVITGVGKCLHERRHELKQYYESIREVSSITEKNPLDEVLTNMLQISSQARRGWLEHSFLHDSMQKEILSFIEVVNYEEMSSKLNEIEEFLREESKKEEELDTYVELFELLEVSDEEKMEAKQPEVSGSSSPLTKCWQKIQELRYRRDRKLSIPSIHKPLFDGENGSKDGLIINTKA